MAPSTSFSTSFILLFLFSAHAMISVDDQINVESKERFSVLWSFEFAVGGSLNMKILMDNTTSMQQPNNSIQFLFCTDRQIDPLRSARLEDVCGTPTFNFVPCVWQGQLGLEYGLSTSFSYNATTESWYRLLQLNCPAGEYSGKLTYVAQNPGGEYLSLSEVPFKTLYVVTAAMWSALAMIWVWNWFRYRWFNIHLQRLITIVPVSKALISLSFLFYWREGSITGQFPSNWAWSNYIFAVLDLGAFFGSLLVIAKGWMITRGRFTKFEIRRVTAMIFLLMLSKAIYTWFNGFVLFFLVIMYVLMLRYIFASIVDNTTVLSNQIGVLRSIPTLNVTNTPVWLKQQMYKRFQVAMVVFISVDVIFHLWATIFLSSTPWVEDTMDHLISALLVISVGYTFAMRPFNPFFFRVVRGDQAALAWESVPSESVSVSSSRGPSRLWGLRDLSKSRKSPLLMSPGTQSDEPEETMFGSYMWRPGMPIPKMPNPADPESWFSWFLGLDSSDSGPGIIIENGVDDRAGHSSNSLFLAEPSLEGPPLHIQGLGPQPFSPITPAISISTFPNVPQPSSSSSQSLLETPSVMVEEEEGVLRQNSPSTDIEMKDFKATA
jgi:hypothetical protein